jgi:hypothetical protein
MRPLKKNTNASQTPHKIKKEGIVSNSCYETSISWYLSNEAGWERNKENNSIQNSLKIIKYLVINQTKEVKDFYNENYIALKNIIKEDIRRWEHLLCSWIKRINNL